MTIIDPHHALIGQQFELVSVHSARGPSFVVIALPDGRRRSVRRSITDLAGAPTTNRSDEALRVSVRTLLPLAQHLATMMTAFAQKGIGHGQTLNPDEEVQARLALVFTTFRAWHSAHAVMRHLRANGLPLPVRSSRGPAPQDVIWREATSARVLSILHNPAYAGAVRPELSETYHT